MTQDVKTLAVPYLTSEALFDEYASDYEQALQRGLAVSGESREYFAEGRVAWLAQRLAFDRACIRRVLDFGCGTGDTTPILERHFAAEAMVGVDVSVGSLAKARQRHGAATRRFMLLEELDPAEAFDLAYCNGVFHHIPVAERLQALRYVFRALRPGGWFGLWENNPWNPGTRYVMSRIPFDRDAVLLFPRETSRLMRQAGFQVRQVDFLFIFPKMLARFRPVEPMLARLPLGAQYLALARRP